jgi:hypothetical protein
MAVFHLRNAWQRLPSQAAKQGNHQNNLYESSHHWMEIKTVPNSQWLRQARKLFFKPSQSGFKIDTKKSVAVSLRLLCVLAPLREIPVSLHKDFCFTQRRKKRKDAQSSLPLSSYWEALDDIRRSLFRGLLHIEFLQTILQRAE